MMTPMRPVLSVALTSWLAIAFLAACLPCVVQAGAADDDTAQTIVHMLDYVGVDYPESVQNGQVILQAEYAEQRSFAAQILTLLGQLPSTPEQGVLVQQARDLVTRIEATAPGPEIAALANQLLTGLIQA